MTERLISFAAGNAPDFDTVDIAAAAAKTGWRACGIWYDPDSWTPRTQRELKAIFRDSGMAALDIEVILIREGELAATDFDLIEAGAELGARNVLIASFDKDIGATARKFRTLAEFALQHGVQPNLEFLPFSAVNSLDLALEIAGEAAQSAVLLDMLHLHRSGGKPADIRKVDPSQLHYAQLCDGVAALADDESDTLIADAMDGRRLPGEGALPTAAFVAELPGDLPLSLEIRSEALREGFPDLDKRAAHMLERTRAAVIQ